MTIAAYLLCALIWSTTWYAIRVGIGPGGYPTFASAALRFVLAAVVLFAMWATGTIGPGPARRRERAWIVIAGLLNAVGYALVYAGEERISGGLAAVLYGTLPLMTAIATYVTGTERPSRSALLGAVISLGGVCVLFADRVEVSAAQGIGVVLVLGSVVACTAYNVMLKRLASAAHPMAVNALFLATTAAAMIGLSVLYERQLPPWPPPLYPTLAIIYLSLVGSVIAFGAYFYLLKRVSLMTVSTLVFIEPVLALLVDAAFEHELRLGGRSYFGVAITLVGVVFSLIIRRS